MKRAPAFSARTILFAQMVGSRLRTTLRRLRLLACGVRALPREVSLQVRACHVTNSPRCRPLLAAWLCALSSCGGGPYMESVALATSLGPASTTIAVDPSLPNRARMSLCIPSDTVGLLWEPGAFDPVDSGGHRVLLNAEMRFEGGASRNASFSSTLRTSSGRWYCLSSIQDGSEAALVAVRATSSHRLSVSRVMVAGTDSW